MKTPPPVSREKKMPTVVVSKVGKEYRVRFNIGVQFFELAYRGTKSEATWMAKMLKEAFNELK